MKTLKFIAVFLTASLIISSQDISAQNKKQCDWQDRIMSEKIAFITMELSLTPEEAQAFWPIYNKATTDRHNSHIEMMKAYKELKAAVEEGTASEKEIQKLLDKYLSAKAAHNSSEADAAARYSKALPAKKVAKLYVAEEKFRRHHIRSMKEGHYNNGGRNNGPGRPADGKPAAR